MFQDISTLSAAYYYYLSLREKRFPGLYCCSCSSFAGLSGRCEPEYPAQPECPAGIFRSVWPWEFTKFLAMRADNLCPISDTTLTLPGHWPDTLPGRSVQWDAARVSAWVGLSGPVLSDCPGQVNSNDYISRGPI
jgi:hypothetical protein